MCKMCYRKCKDCPESINNYRAGGGLTILCKVQGSTLFVKKCPKGDEENGR